MKNGRHWLLTVPHHMFVPWLPSGVAYIRGQLERGTETEFLHWQLYVCFDGKASLRTVREVFGKVHSELSRSTAARDYVWKEETRVFGTQFELGRLPVRRNDKHDWGQILDNAKKRDFGSIPPDVFIRYYSGIRNVASHYDIPRGIEKEVYVYWGETGSGKSRKAWEENPAAFPKDPCTKFWCGYSGEESVIIDEFRGQIGISHLLRWTDRYPVRVEIKGGRVALHANKFFITSNLAPDQWYPELDAETLAALKRRFTKVIKFSKHPFNS